MRGVTKSRGRLGGGGTWRQAGTAPPRDLMSECGGQHTLGVAKTHLVAHSIPAHVAVLVPR